ncbi:MAG: DUF6858 family protein [Solirubrobacterales bacterium]
MKQVTFMEKYPVFVAEIGKDETTHGDVDAIVAYLKDCIAGHGKAVFISAFDHYEHTRSLGGEIGAGILAAKNVIFCFGFALPNATVMGVRPRSIGVCDMGDKFVVSFLEAPVKPANDSMEAWVKAIRNR